MQTQHVAPQAMAFIGVANFPPTNAPSIAQLYNAGKSVNQIRLELNLSYCDITNQLTALADQGAIKLREVKKQIPLKVRVTAVKMLNQGKNIKEVMAFAKKQTGRTYTKEHVKSWRNQKIVQEHLKKEQQ